MKNYEEYLDKVSDLNKKTQSNLSISDCYVLNEDLFQYFGGVNRQFTSWLDNASLSETIVSKIIEGIEITIPILSKLKYKIETYTEDDLESDIKTHVDHIKRNMLLSECKIVLEELNQIEEKVERQRKEYNEAMELITKQNHEIALKDKEYDMKKMELDHIRVMKSDEMINHNHQKNMGWI